MATNYLGLPVVDPDDLPYTIAATDIATNFAACTTPLLIDTANKRIALKVNDTDMTEDGATIKAVYSKLKEAWKDDTTLIKFPFPMGPITDEQFEMVNGWNWDKTQTSGDASATTVELLRTGGWSVVNTSGNITERWAGIVSLGTLINVTDQIYYQQVSSATASVNFKLTGPVNQAVQIIRDDDGDGVYAESSDYDRRTYFKIFVREQGKTYSQSEIADIGVTAMDYQAYRFPLTNATDLKISYIDAAIGGTATSSGTSSGTTATVNTTANHGLSDGDSVKIAGVTPSGYNGTFTATLVDANTITYTTVGSNIGPITVQGTVTKDVYTDISIEYLRDSLGDLYNVIGLWVSGTTYAIGDVVQSVADDRWYKRVVAGAGTTDPASDGTNYDPYEGERLIGDVYYPFTVIIDGDGDVGSTASGDASTQEIYEKVQYLLRQASDIDTSAGTVTGKTADALLTFVGDTLVTSQGVYIDSFNVNDTNSITLTDATGASINFPFVASLTINFGTNLVNDASSKYWVFFQNDDAGDNTGRDFGTSTAIIVQDADGVNMANTISGNTSFSRSYDYSTNVQRGAASANTNAPITVVGIGLSTGQYVQANTTILRTTTNSVTLTAALERNYANPA